jgi:hypothetical protein
MNRSANTKQEHDDDREADIADWIPLPGAQCCGVVDEISYADGTVVLARDGQRARVPVDDVALHDLDVGDLLSVAVVGDSLAFGLLRLSDLEEILADPRARA